jgi:hypothetical protein
MVDNYYKMYVDQLSDKEKLALEIAKRMLGSSFCLEKSIGYLQFKKRCNPPL